MAEDEARLADRPGREYPAKQAAAPARKFGLRDLAADALGLAAGGALASRFMPATTPTGRDRLVVAASQARELIHPSGVAPPRLLDTRDGQRFAEAVRGLTD